MAANGSQEHIDFDFFDEDDNRSHSKGKSPTGVGEKSRSRPSSGRPDSVRSTSSSLSIKIPTANNTPRERRENRYSSSDEEDDHSPKGVNGFDKSDQKRDKNSDRSRSDSGGSSTRGKNRHNSGSSNSSYSSSLDSKSADSDSSSSSESVTDVSPIQSPLSRSPSPPRLRYNHAEMDSSPEHSSKKLAKDSVRFKEPSPKGGCVRPPSGSRKNTQLAETEANELSMLLRAVLEMEETPHRRSFQDFEQPRLSNSRPSSGKRPMSGKAMPHQRMNMSFSNDEVRKIDQDNQRLLKKIVNPPSSVPKPEKKRPSSGRMRTRSASYGSIPSRPTSGHISHSALLRQRDQRRIEMENMKILRRIESAKPTSELQAKKLKNEFRKQQQYSSQVSRTPVRPSSAQRADTGSRGMSKATSLQSLRSDYSHASSSTASSRVRSRPSSAKYGPGAPASRPSWDDHFAY